MKIGLKARFSDLDGVLSLKPELVELHFSDKDPDYDFNPPNKINIPCIIHLPEIWNGYLIDIASIKTENQVLSLRESRHVLQEIISKSERFFKFFNNDKNLFVLHPGGMTFERDLLESNKFRTEALLETLSMIKTNNSEILVENLPPFPWYFGGQWITNYFMDAQEIKEFCDKTSKKICFDTSHSMLYCNYSKKDFYKETEIIKEHIQHLQVADAKGVDVEGVQIGEGDIDFKNFFNIIKDYEGSIVNEVWQGFLNDFAGFKIATQRINKYLKNLEKIKK